MSKKKKKSVRTDDTSQLTTVPARQQRGSARRRRGDLSFATEEDCLAALSRLPGLITMGLITTAQANAIRGTYATILQHHHHSAQGDAAQQTLADEDVLTMLRANPELLNMLEPFLTDDQIAMAMKDDQGGQDGQV
jgi:hypothetical protein